MRNHDLWASLVLLFLGAVICWESLKLELGSWSNPGPGFLPFGSSLALICISLGILILSLSRREQSAKAHEKFWQRQGSWKPVFLILFSLVGFNLFLTKLGFFLTTFLFMASLLIFVGKLKWWVGVFGAVLTAFVTYLLFVSFLKVQLPHGPLGF